MLNRALLAGDSGAEPFEQLAPTQPLGGVDWVGERRLASRTARCGPRRPVQPTGAQGAANCQIQPVRQQAARNRRNWRAVRKLCQGTRIAPLPPRQSASEQVPHLNTREPWHLRHNLEETPIFTLCARGPKRKKICAILQIRPSFRRIWKLKPAHVGQARLPLDQRNPNDGRTRQTHVPPRRCGKPGRTPRTQKAAIGSRTPFVRARNDLRRHSCNSPPTIRTWTE
jgi:hypothetical protein